MELSPAARRLADNARRTGVPSTRSERREALIRLLLDQADPADQEAGGVLRQHQIRPCHGWTATEYDGAMSQLARRAYDASRQATPRPDGHTSRRGEWDPG